MGWERLKAGAEGDDRRRDGWMASLTQWTWIWVNSGVGNGHGSLACYSPWDHKESDMTEELNWTMSFSDFDSTGLKSEIQGGDNKLQIISGFNVKY